MELWGDSRTVRAVVVRDILRGRLIDDPDPGGLRLRGALIAGRLDLRHVTCGMPLYLFACYLPDGADMSGSELPGLGLRQCRAEREIRLLDAHIGELDLSGATLRHDSGPALDASRVHVDSAAFLRGGFTATGAGDDGALRLSFAHVGAFLDLTRATLHNDSGPALHADRLQVGQSLSLFELLHRDWQRRDRSSTAGRRTDRRPTEVVRRDAS